MRKALKLATTFLVAMAVLFSFKVTAAAQPLIHIDSPANGSTVATSATVSGWSLDRSGVKSVAVYINGKKVGNAKTGLLRNDVNKALNSNGAYKNGKYSGFSYSLDMSSYQDGTYTLKVVSTGNNGATVSASSKFTKSTGKIHIDNPSKSGISVDSDLNINGWSLNTSGVKAVDVSVDGKVVGSAQIGQTRNDVGRVYGSMGYKDADKSGFSYKLSYSSLSKGSHTITLTSKGKNGTDTSTKFTINVVKPESKVYIDTGSNNKLYMTDTLTVSGWSFSNGGVKSVDVYISGKKVGSANTEAANDGSGKVNYTFTLSDTSAYSAGDYTVKVVATGSDNAQISSTVTATKLATRICIDKPSNKATVNTDFTLSGWAVSAEGISKVQILVDGSQVATATTGLTRNDVKKALNNGLGYKDSELSGFTCTVPLDTVKPGSHKVTVRAVSAQSGAATDVSITVNVSKASPIAWIDSPKSNNAYITDSLTVRGWSVSASGVKNVEVYIDGKDVGSAEVGLTRNDVDKSINAKKVYKNADKSGYSLTVTGLENYSVGEHTVKIVSTGNDGDTATYQSTVNKVAPIIGLDLTSTTVNSNFSVTGWIFNAAGTSKVEVYCGSNLVGTATLGLDSTDKMAVYDKNGIKYKDPSKSRFKAEIPIISLPYGKNTLKVKATGNDGSVTTATMTVEVVSAKSLAAIDSPKSGQNFTYNDKTIVVSGWALNVSGISEIQVYIDDIPVDDVTYGLGSGSGVINVAQGKYIDAENARFKTGEIDITGLSYGEHIVKVVAIGNNGGVDEYTTTFTKSATAFTEYDITVSEMASKNNVSESLIDPEQIIAKDDAGIYEFMTLNYVDGITADDLDKMLKGCGVLEGKGAVFLEAGKKYNVNPVYLVAHALVESGRGTSKLSTGVQVPAGTYTFSGKSKTVAAGTYYNQFGINAVDNDPINQGAKYAAYSGWNSVDASIMGGAEWISKIYIWGGKPNQDTIYEMRFDPLYWVYPTQYKKYEYATSKTWAHSIASIIAQYEDIFNGIQLTFDIPKYKD